VYVVDLTDVTSMFHLKIPSVSAAACFISLSYDQGESWASRSKTKGAAAQLFCCFFITIASLALAILSRSTAVRSDESLE